MDYLMRARRAVLTEWRYTYRSARRDGHSKRIAARKFGRELGRFFVRCEWRHP